LLSQHSPLSAHKLNHLLASKALLIHLLLLNQSLTAQPLVLLATK